MIILLDSPFTDDYKNDGKQFRYPKLKPSYKSKRRPDDILEKTHCNWKNADDKKVELSRSIKLTMTAADVKFYEVLSVYFWEWHC